MNRIAAGWLLAVIIESSRTAESCLSCYHLKMYNKQFLIEKNSKNKKKSMLNSSIIENKNKKGGNKFYECAFTCKSGFPEGVNSPNNFTWNIWTSNGLYVTSI